MSVHPDPGRTIGRATHSRAAAPGPGSSAVILACVAVPVLTANVPTQLGPRLIAAFTGSPAGGMVLPLLIVVPALLAGILSPLAGRMVDSFGRVRPLVGGLLLNGVAGTVPLWSGRFDAVVAGRVGVGVADAIVSTCVVTLLGDRYRGRPRNQAFGLFIVVGTVFAVVVQVSVGVLADRGWQAPFALHGVAVVLALLVALSVREQRRLTRAGARRLPPLRWRSLRVSAGVMMVAGVLFYVPVIQLPQRIGEFGAMPAAQVITTSALVGLGTVAGALAYGRLGQIGVRRLLPVAFAAVGVGAVGMGWGASLPVVVAAGVVGAIGCGLLLPTMLTWMLGDLNLEQRGRGSGWWASGQTLGPVVLSLIVLLVDGPRGGSVWALVLIGAVAVVLAAFSPWLVGLSERAPTGVSRAR